MFVVLKIAGAAYLMWLGIKMWRRPSTGAVPVASAPPKIRTVRAAATGLALGLSNPQAIVFYVALLPAVITPGAGAGLYAVQLPFQGLHLRGDRRLDVAQLGGRGGEAARPDQGLEQPQQIRLHRAPTYRLYRSFSSILFVGSDDDHGRRWIP